jgi:hypothetical protein
MTVTPKVLQEIVELGTTDPAEGSGKYTSPTGATTIIVAANAFNSSASPVAVTLNVVAPAGAVAATNIMNVITIAAGASYNFPELVNQRIAPAGFVSLKAGTANVVRFRMSGSQIT